MYLSKLVLNPSSRRVRTEIGRLYELHRTLMQAFPSAQDGGRDRVLFRVDSDRETGTLILLVQSVQKPDWSILETTRDFLQESLQCKQFPPSFSVGQQLNFRFRANPPAK